jgi:hypothetical protein
MSLLVTPEHTAAAVVSLPEADRARAWDVGAAAWTAIDALPGSGVVCHASAFCAALELWGLQDAFRSAAENFTTLWEPPSRVAAERPASG